LQSSLSSAESALSTLRAERELLLTQRDPEIVRRQEEERRVREEEERRERAEREERERMERERLQRLEEERIRREEEERRAREEEERRQREEAALKKKQEEEAFWREHKMDSDHFRYYNPKKMTTRDLYGFYKFSLTDPNLSGWQDKFKSDLHQKFNWMVYVRPDKELEQIRLSFDPKYAELGSLHNFVGKLTRFRRYYTKHDVFPHLSLLPEQYKYLSSFH